MPVLEAVALLRAVVRSPECAKMNLSTVKGYMGELLIKQTLESELRGSPVEHFGNQHSHDLQYEHSGKTIRIDVKTSTAKDERKWGFPYWSWALLNDTKKKQLSATHFICAGLNKELDLEAVFVVAVANMAHFPRDTGQFRNNKHALFLAQSLPPASAPGTTNDLYIRSAQLLQDGKVQRVDREESLVLACS